MVWLPIIPETRKTRETTVPKRIYQATKPQTLPTQSPTYDPKTGTYTDEYGGKYSVPPEKVPAGTTPASFVPSTSPGGGGRRDSSYPQSVATPQQLAESRVPLSQTVTNQYRAVNFGYGKGMDTAQRIQAGVITQSELPFGNIKFKDWNKPVTKENVGEFQEFLNKVKDYKTNLAEQTKKSYEQRKADAGIKVKELAEQYQSQQIKTYLENQPSQPTKQTSVPLKIGNVDWLESFFPGKKTDKKPGKILFSTYIDEKYNLGTRYIGKKILSTFPEGSIGKKFLSSEAKINIPIINKDIELSSPTLTDTLKFGMFLPLMETEPMIISRLVRTKQIIPVQEIQSQSVLYPSSKIPETYQVTTVSKTATGGARSTGISNSIIKDISETEYSVQYSYGVVGSKPFNKQPIYQYIEYENLGVAKQLGPAKKVYANKYAEEIIPYGTGFQSSGVTRSINKIDIIKGTGIPSRVSIKPLTVYEPTIKGLVPRYNIEKEPIITGIIKPTKYEDIFAYRGTTSKPYTRLTNTAFKKPFDISDANIRGIIKYQDKPINRMAYFEDTSQGIITDNEGLILKQLSKEKQKGLIVAGNKEVLRQVAGFENVAQEVLRTSLRTPSTSRVSSQLGLIKTKEYTSIKPSIYQGTGVYERTEPTISSRLKGIDNSDFRTISKPDIRSSYDVLTKQDLRLNQELKNQQREREISITIPKTDMLTSQKQRVNQKINLMLRLKTEESSRFNIRIPRASISTGKIITAKTFSEKNKYYNKDLSIKGYDVFKIKKRKPVIIAKGLYKASALDIGARETLKDLTATFGIRRSDMNPRDIATNKEFSRLSSLFRRPVSRSRYNQYGDVYIQKQTRTALGRGRLTSKGELMDIQSSRLNKMMKVIR